MIGNNFQLFLLAQNAAIIVKLGGGWCRALVIHSARGESLLRLEQGAGPGSHHRARGVAGIRVNQDIKARLWCRPSDGVVWVSVNVYPSMTC